MLVDVLRLNEKLSILEAAVRDLRLELKNIGPRVDGIESLALAAVMRDQKRSLTQGYTTLSPDVGLFIPNGSISLEVSERSSGTVLQLLADDGGMIPEHFILQLNLGPQFFKARDAVTVAASWIGEPLTPQIDCRFVADGEIVRRDLGEVETQRSASSMRALAHFTFPSSVKRSDGIDQVQLCLLFKSNALGAEITSLFAH